MLSLKKKVCFKNNCNYFYFYIILFLKIFKDLLLVVRKENYIMLYIFIVWKKKMKVFYFLSLMVFLGFCLFCF